MRGFMQRFQPMTTNSLLLVLCLFLVAGCSWTSRQLGMSDSSSDNEKQQTDSAQGALPDNANLADKEALLRLDFGITEPIRLVSNARGPVQKQPSYTTPVRNKRNKKAPKMVVKRQPPKMAEKSPLETSTASKTQAPKSAPQEKAAKENNTPATPEATMSEKTAPTNAQANAPAPQEKKPEIDPKKTPPPTQFHTSVPFEPAKKTAKTPPAQSKKMEKRGDIRYENTKALREAVDKALEQKSFLGYTDPFDAFPAIKGNDTMSAAFIPVDHPNHKVFYHAFYTPDRPFNRRVYGYTVIDMITKKDYGHFDGNADGKFEQNTLHPKVIFDEYLRTSKSQFGEKMPEAAKKKKK